MIWLCTLNLILDKWYYTDYSVILSSFQVATWLLKHDFLSCIQTFILLQLSFDYKISELLGIQTQNGFQDSRLFNNLSSDNPM